MPRKPTPKILNEPEQPLPSTEEVIEDMKTETADVGDTMENIPPVEPIEETLEKVEMPQTPAEEPVMQEIPPTEETGDLGEVAELAPEPSPLYGPMRTLLLASLGAVSYAIQEAEFVVRKLVERGELTQKEGSKLMGMMMKRMGPPPKSSEKPAEGAGAQTAEGGEAPAGETPDKPSGVLIHLPVFRRFAKAPEAPEATGEVPEEMGQDEVIDETKTEEEETYMPKNIVTFNILSFGSPVMIEKRKKPKK